MNRARAHSRRYFVSARTHPGFVRENNEDSCAVDGWTARAGEDAWVGEIGIGSWAIIADGMGGHAAGELASRLAIEHLSFRLAAARSMSDVDKAIQGANGAIHEAVIEGRGPARMGTTIVGLLVGRNNAIVFNVGDSRAYVADVDRLEQISEDHTLKAPWPSSARKRSHVLTQSLGGAPTLVRVEPSISEVPLLEGRRIVLCSDGLTDMVADEDIHSMVSGAFPRPADRIVQAALNAGGVDNVTVVVIEPIDAN